jgi:hypothetical protein
LFADIKGSMELEPRPRGGPRDRRSGNQAYDRGGASLRRLVVQSTGDGIFALFGAPVSHEDHPQRALYTAVRMQEEMRRYGDRVRAQGQTPIQVRIGVNTGEVVVRSNQTSEGHTEYTPIGHSTSLAARLQTLATPGSIVISGYTRRFVEGYFQLKSLESTRVKGVKRARRCVRSHRVGSSANAIAGGGKTGLTRFVGREREMDALRHAAAMARSGHGQVVAAMAEPGVGKSRLFHVGTVKFLLLVNYRPEYAHQWNVGEKGRRRPTKPGQ